MFTDLFQLEQKPVTVFSSDDAGAPILTKDAGSLKTLLKACLVTGYGDKTALGWQMLFESADTLSAAFASTDPTASKFVLKINNSGATTAKISAYQSMTDINTGIKPMAVDNDYELFNCSWRLIGHSKAFILLLDARAYDGTYYTSRIAYPIVFGDIPRESNRLAHAVIFWTARRAEYWQGSLQTTLGSRNDGQTSNASSSTNSFSYLNNYPVIVNDGTGGKAIQQAACKFSWGSRSQATLLHDAYIIALPDSTWSMIPMLQPLSNITSEISNLGKISQTAIKALTSNWQLGAYNGDCAVPTDWWWA